MIEFQQKFIDDAGELIEKLETELIHFENDLENETTIQELFRVMHTLKGSSGMFGFNRIEEFTHILEDVYDLIRNKQLSINKDIINLTFAAIDLLKILLTTKEVLNEEQDSQYSEIVTTAKRYASMQQPEAPEETIEENYGDVVLYCVLFKPLPNILLRGIKPDGIIEELKNIGNHAKFQYTDEEIEITDDLTYNQMWEFFFGSSTDLEELEDIFMFLDESEFKIEALNDNSKNAIEQFLSTTLSINYTALDKLQEEIEPLLLAPKKTEVVETKVETAAAPTIATPVDDFIRVPSAKLDLLLNLVSELIITQAQYESHSKRLADEQLTKTTVELSKISRSFRDEIFSIRLVPLNILATGMQRLVRDLSQKLGKEVELITEGLHTELDKNIINRIESPIMHIIRNSLDHGIETPDVRLQNDKKETGVLRFISFYSGASVFIQIQDDGKGIDTEYIFEKAVSKGIVKYDDVLTTKQIYELIFIPGFSTSSEVSDVSGRGVGLDVVKGAITDLHGEINIDSEVGLGTSFTIKLPLTLSIVDALLVYVNELKLLIPTSNILTCKHLSSEHFKEKDLNYNIDGKCIPVVRLTDIFSTKEHDTEFEVLIIIVIYEKQFGLLVDRILTSMQAVIKPLGKLHNKQPYFIGASQLGDGSMAYILDTNFLLKI